MSSCPSCFLFSLTPARNGGDERDSFDVVVPSLPGFAFSGQLDRPGLCTSAGIAELWIRLMTDHLGFTRFGAQSQDIGAAVTISLGAASHQKRWRHLKRPDIVGERLLGRTLPSGGKSTFPLDSPLLPVSSKRVIAQHTRKSSERHYAGPALTHGQTMVASFAPSWFQNWCQATTCARDARAVMTRPFALEALIGAIRRVARAGLDSAQPPATAIGCSTAGDCEAASAVRMNVGKFRR